MGLWLDITYWQPLLDGGNSPRHIWLDMTTPPWWREKVTTYLTWHDYHSLMEEEDHDISDLTWLPLLDGGRRSRHIWLNMTTPPWWREKVKTYLTWHDYHSLMEGEGHDISDLTWLPFLDVGRRSRHIWLDMTTTPWCREKVATYLTWHDYPSLM